MKQIDLSVEAKENSIQTVPQCRFNRSLKLVIPLASLLLIPTFSPIAFADDDSDKMGVCSRITTLAFRACKHDIKDDYLINKANCLNTDDRVEKKECLVEAKMEQHDEDELCGEQREARLEVCEAIGDGPYVPDLDPALFLSAEMAAANPNPLFPLTPGLIRIYQSEDETITVTVTEDTLEIAGIETIVVRDVVEEDGELVEDTDDWYAQDIYGNVWYFGEISKNYEDGKLKDLDGSWQTGEDGAQPGIIMFAVPEEGSVYRQEYALAEAEDMAEIDTLEVFDESTPVADCSLGCLLTREFTPIEPDVEEFKYFAPGIGNILVINPEDGIREELVDIVYP